jgi:integrase
MSSSKSRLDCYQKVYDSRKRRMRGLWQRNERYYANLTVTDDLGVKSSRWVPLEVPLDGSSLTEAKADYDRLKVERADDRLRPLGLTPTVRDYIQKSYIPQLDASGKRSSSIQKDKSYLNRWTRKIGDVRLNKLRPFHLNKFLTELADEKYSARSINLYLIAIRGMIKAGLRDGLLKPPLPFEGLTWQRVDTKARSLFTPEEINQICAVAMRATKNGRQFVDYLRFMQYSGARRSEALRVRVQDVDFGRGHVTIGAEGDSKNREPRYVDLNPQLKAHLQDMRKRRQPDSQWLFPSPQRGDADISARTFMESLRLTRQAKETSCQHCDWKSVNTTLEKCPECGSGKLDSRGLLAKGKLPKFGFHDLRHHFISYAVMSGVDFMTVANWCGHKDGGILIGKIYGHLAEGHRKAQAARVMFGTTRISSAETVTASSDNQVHNPPK